MTDKDVTDELQLVAFKIDHEEFAVDILLVQEIEKLANITRVPRTNDAIEGVINLRGEVIPVINLRKRMNLQQRELRDEDKIVIIKANDTLAGIIVDAVSEVVRLPASQVENTFKLDNSLEEEYIEGVGKIGERLLILVNLEKIIDLE
ncbi:purine-binding chemotaxis protein CheW [Desulfitispora alkaliphila]|uniref:chemotaxis protein CheW n=1 Tax=Desulfitispora alkaliphila TaxID=622674 RepID=UPI003D1C57F2